MDYAAYNSDGMVSGGKANAYKSHIIKNIEVIGQRKLVVIGEDADYELLLKTVDQLRKKNVRVPEIAFRVTVSESEADEEKNIRFIDVLKDKGATFYVLILKPFGSVEAQLAAMAGVVGTSQEAVQALKSVCGYTERDFCEMNDPEGSGLKGSLGGSKAASALSGDAKKSASMASTTAAQLAGYRAKMNGQRCFILGTNSAKLEELNVMLNERTIACNDFCDFFSRTPQRPAYYLLTNMQAYLGNGKYIEGMECFVNGDIKVFEDKFKKKPTYLSHLGAGLIEELPAFSTAQQRWETAAIMPLYQMIQIALYMGFSEIYVYGFDGLFALEYDGTVGRSVGDGEAADYPEAAKSLLRQVKSYADSKGVRMVTMCRTEGLSMFESVKFEDIDFSSSMIFGRI